MADSSKCTSSGVVSCISFEVIEPTKENIQPLREGRSPAALAAFAALSSTKYDPGMSLYYTAHICVINDNNGFGGNSLHC
jgi:hypothetical protein